MWVWVCVISYSEENVEYWIESDIEIDEDIDIAYDTPPPDVAVSGEESHDRADVQISTRWIIALLTIFQSRFFLTNRALDWLLKFIVVVFKHFGNYSETLLKLLVNYLILCIYTTNQWRTLCPWTILWKKLCVWDVKLCTILKTVTKQLA